MRVKRNNMKRGLSTKVCRLFVTSFFGLALVISIFVATVFSTSTFAETFESEQGISFTFNPMVNVTISGGTGASSSGLTIDNLTPGDYKDSNIITVTASSNSPLGYTLSSTVGNATYNSTELRRGGTETANKFTNLTTNKASLSNFDANANTWGYSYAPCTTVECTNTPSWISGDITGTTNAGYNGLPLYTTSSPIKLINSTSPSASAVLFKIGARATTSQVAGTYSNVVNFIGISKIVTTNYTINYNANAGSDTVTNMPTPNPLTGTESNGTGAVKISSNVPARANYMFKGWCTSQTTDDTCSSDVVQPGGYVALNPGTSSATANVTKDLYAMWKEDTKVLGYTTNYTGGEIASYEWTSIPPTTTAPTITKIEVPDGMHYRDGSQVKVYTKNAAAVVFSVNGVKYTRPINSEGMAKLNINLFPGTYPIEMVAVEKNVQGDFGYAMASLPYTFTVLPAE